jgi:transposase, IS6 family
LTEQTRSHTINPRVINVDKSPAFPPALNELQAENEVPIKSKLRAVKYLNNRMENDHKRAEVYTSYVLISYVD